MNKSQFERLEETQIEALKLAKGRSTEKRIEDFDLGKMLGKKF